MKPGIFAVVCVALFTVTCLSHGDEIFLGELEPVSFLSHGGLKVDTDYYNETIKMDGEEYEKGLVMHVESPQGYSEAIYDVEGYKTFRAEIGLSHRDEPPQGSVLFFVYIDDGKGDWIEKYKSEEVIKHETPTIQLEIDIKGASQLRLYCTDADGSINSDHATFANARLDTASLSGLTVKPPGRLVTTWASIKKR